MLANHIDITMVNVPQVIINLMVLAHTTLKKDMWARIQKVNKILALTTFLFTSTTLYSSFEMPNFYFQYYRAVYYRRVAVLVGQLRHLTIIDKIR